MGYKCSGCYIWEVALYVGCMFTPAISNNIECPCVECIVKSMCDIHSRVSCSRFNEYLTLAERIIYE